jgi:F-type H+-transporting ATPase subunit delta
LPAETGARRYAAAAFEVAVEDGKLDEWSTGVDELSALFANPQAARFFADGKTPNADKFKVLDEVLAGAEPRVLNLGRLLIDKGRTSLAPAISRELQEMIDDHKGIAHARVTTAVELTPEAERSLRARLEQITGKQVEMEPVVDPAIIGGMVARIGDRVIDGSTRTKLVALKKKLEGQPR